MKLISLIRRIVPFKKEDEERFLKWSQELSKEDSKFLKKYLKLKEISFAENKISNSFASFNYVQLKYNNQYNSNENKSVEKKEVKEFADRINIKIKNRVDQTLFSQFAPFAFQKISSLVAPDIHGNDHLKESATIILFSDEPLHLLLLGDPGTGKTDIIRSAAELHPKHSFGLGSGTSGAGLVVSAKGNEIIPGLLPLADGGICAIDELNLMKEESRAGLYNAMEKGFVSYDKGGHHYKFNSRVNVIATANPKGDSFTAKNLKELKMQLPFEDALLSRFHLLFFIYKPGIEEFKKISKSILTNSKSKIKDEDIEFVKEYITYALKIKVSFPSEFEPDITNIVAKIKSNENKYARPISPRFVIGLMRMCKALARSRLSSKVERIDLDKAQEILEKSLEWKL